MTLNEDFGIWWNMAKYKDADIPAKELGNANIVCKHGGSHGWAGEKGVKYWVELDNGFAVGILTPKKGNATFPFYKIG